MEMGAGQDLSAVRRHIYISQHKTWEHCDLGTLFNCCVRTKLSVDRDYPSCVFQSVAERVACYALVWRGAGTVNRPVYASIQSFVVQCLFCVYFKQGAFFHPLGLSEGPQQGVNADETHQVWVSRLICIFNQRWAVCVRVLGLWRLCESSPMHTPSAQLLPPAPPRCFHLSLGCCWGDAAFLCAQPALQIAFVLSC